MNPIRPGRRTAVPTASLLRFALTVLWLALAAVSAARAENLVSLRHDTLPALQTDDALAHVVVLGGQPVVLGARSAWLLDGASARWTRLDWRPGGRVIASAGGAEQALLLLEDAGTSGIRVVSLSHSIEQLEAQPLATLPGDVTHAQIAREGGSIVVAVQAADGTLRLLELDAASGWSERATLDASGARLTSLVVQNSGWYVTLEEAGAGGDRLLEWKRTGGWKEIERLPGAVVAGAARPIGQAHALYLVRPESGSARQLVTFHTITGVWSHVEAGDAHGATGAAAWQDGLLWQRPEPEAAGSQLGAVQVTASKLLLEPFDWLVIVVYLAGMTGIGLYFYLRERRISTADFFVGGRAIPFWAAGVSLYATNTSSISYIAIPAKSFETNWQYLTNNLIAVLGLMFVAVWIVPLLRRLDLMSVFHYLEIRFHPVIRMLASALCIAMQIGSRLSVVLFLPSLAISTITGIDVVWSILIMGTITIAYTTLGGMKAVIWTDFVQLFVMFGGALFSIAYILGKLDGGIGALFEIAAAEQKMKVFDWRFDLAEATVWGFIFLVAFDVVLTFPKDQVLMQRVLSTRSARQAGWSVWTFAAIMIPGGVLFYLIGTALYAYYQMHPERMNPLLTNDATFPLFIAAELPVGITGLIIAGILAASMSTLSSIMNSVATLLSVDFYEKLAPRQTAARSVRVAEVMTVVTGLIGMGGAWLLSRYDIHSLFDVSIELAGLLGGGFAGAYTLGMFTRRANWQGVSIGIASAIVLTTAAWTIDLVHPYYYLAISIMVCIIAGYLASLLFAPPGGSLAGLTIHDGRHRTDASATLASSGS